VNCRGGCSGGFTLLELLVAMAIFAVVGVMAMGGLNSVLTQTAQTKTQLERLHEVQRAVRLIGADLSQASPRMVRDELGAATEPPFMAAGTSDELLRLTRDGWRNPFALQPRGTLQRVHYRLEKDQLIREYWRVLDRTLTEPPRTQTVVGDVESVELQFMDNAGEWQQEWPPVQTKSGAPPSARPRAVKLQLKLKQWGLIERLFEVPQ
jgi:general secretion pathway protein J